MASALELETLMITLAGDGSKYDRVLKDAVRQTEKAAKDIKTSTDKVMRQQSKTMMEAARITKSLATPTQKYAKQVKILSGHFREGRISQATYNRGIKEAKAILPQTAAALAKVTKEAKSAALATEQLAREQKSAASAAKIATAAQDRLNKETAEAKRITMAAMSPMMQYKAELKKITALYKKGAISANTYKRSMKGLNKQFGAGKNAMGAMGSKMKSVGGGMRNIGLAATIGVTLPVVGMVKSFSSFDGAMTKSLAIMGNVAPALRKEMEETARVLGRETTTSAKDAADAFFFLASAGFTAEQSIAALSTVNDFAIAGQFDMATATDLLTDAQSALGLTMDDSVKNQENMLMISDKLVKANTLANASVQQFSEALTADAGTAIKTYNMDLNESIAILAVYADKGKKGAEAGNMFGRMSRLMVKSISENSAAFKELGIETHEFAMTGKNITQVLDGITKATKGMGPAQKSATLEMLGFQALAQKSILPLLGVTDQIKEYEKALGNAGGTTKEVSEKQMAAFGAQMEILWNNVKDLGIEVGKTLAPAIKSLGSVIKDAIDWFRGLSDGTKKFLTYALGLVAILAPIVLGLGFMVIALGAVATAIGGVTVAGLALTASIIGYIALFALVAVAVYAVVDAFTEADLGFLSFVRSIEIGGNSLGAWVDVISIKMWKAWDWTIGHIEIAFSGLWNYIADGIGAVYRLMLQLGKGITAILMGTVKMAANLFLNLAKVAAQAASYLDPTGIANAAIKGIESIQAGMDKAGDVVGQAYEDKINDSLKASENRWKEHNKIVGDLAKNQAQWDQQAFKTLNKDSDRINSEKRASKGKDSRGKQIPLELKEVQASIAEATKAHVGEVTDAGNKSLAAVIAEIEKMPDYGGINAGRKDLLIDDAKKKHAEKLEKDIKQSNAMGVAMAAAAAERAAEEHKKLTASAVSIMSEMRTPAEVLREEMEAVQALMTGLAKTFAKGEKLDLKSGLDKKMEALKKELDDVLLAPQKEADEKAMKDAEKLSKEQEKEMKAREKAISDQAQKAIKSAEKHLKMLEKAKSDEIKANKKEISDMERLLEIAKEKGDDSLVDELNAALKDKTGTRDDKEFKDLMDRFTGSGMESELDKKRKDSETLQKTIDGETKRQAPGTTKTGGFPDDQINTKDNRNETNNDGVKRDSEETALQRSKGQTNDTQAVIDKSKKALQKVEDKLVAEKLQALIELLEAQALQQGATEATVG